jgi:hypothetical protein
MKESIAYLRRMSARDVGSVTKNLAGSCTAKRDASGPVSFPNTQNGHDRRARAADQLVKIVPWRERVAVEPRDNFAHQGYMTFLPGVDACCCAARRVAALRNVVRESSDRREF